MALAGVNAIRPAALSDLETILTLQRSIRSMPQWNVAAWEQMLLGDPAAGGTHLVSVAERAGELAGYVVSNLVAGESELEALAVKEPYRRLGLGRALCRAWMAEAAAMRADRLLLEVRASNEPAIALYAALGFEVGGRREAYYSAPVEDALLMARLLPPVSAARV